MVQKSIFGIINDKQVNQYKIKNSSGTHIELIDFGAILKNLFIKDKNENFNDIVLGYDCLDDYLNDAFYLGSIVGRFANRIANGKFSIGDNTYNLFCNNGENHLHGGKVGFNKVIWKSDINSKKPNSVIFSYLSLDGEEGYPGNVNISVEYQLTDENELVINYQGSSDKTTILNPSHHSYFNLSGSLSSSIENHQITINANAFTPINKNLIPTGELQQVNGSPFDFRKSKTIGFNIESNDVQLILAGGYDHNFVLNDYLKGKVQHAVRVEEPISGRVMDVSTDQPGIQFYSGNFLNNSIVGKNKITYNYRSGFCLETQYFPDSPNQKLFPSVILKPGEIYQQKTIYRFSIVS